MAAKSTVAEDEAAHACSRAVSLHMRFIPRRIPILFVALITACSFKVLVKGGHQKNYEMRENQRVFLRVGDSILTITLPKASPNFGHNRSLI